MRLGHITGAPIKAPENFKGVIRPKWISYAYEGQGAEGAQAVADGWQWFADAVKGIAVLKNGRGQEQERQLADEVQGFLETDYVGQNTNHRLDASVTRAR
eukprot:1762590-Pyramimonas_sp.AAC.1